MKMHYGCRDFAVGRDVRCGRRKELRMSHWKDGVDIQGDGEDSRRSTCGRGHLENCFGHDRFKMSNR